MNQSPPEATDHGSIINDASAWVLRVGVVASVLVMLGGIGVSFIHGTLSLHRVQTATFTCNPGEILRGIAGGHGQSIIEAGIYLLVLTPIMRVFMSMILFVFAERDWVYGVITLGVLALTLVGLLFVG